MPGDAGVMEHAAAAILFAGVLLYAVFGGADFGGGLWDLTAGGAQRGERPRDLIERTIGPVWEANHVWLIFVLVVAWTAFPAAFAAVMRTLYVPLGLAALGIVLRGSGFAFRKAAGMRHGRTHGWAFAASSVVTPFFLGTVAGTVASGGVTPATAADPVAGWLSPTALLAGAMAVAMSAYVAGVFLVAEARLRGMPDLERWFRARSIVAAAVAGGLAVTGLLVVRADAPRLFDGLLRGPGLPFVAGSVVAGLVTLALLGRSNPLVTRLLAVGNVGLVIVGWGVAQYPYLLGDRMTIAEAAAPPATLWAVAVVFGAAAVTCVPSLVILYRLQQRGRLDAH